MGSSIVQDKPLEFTKIKEIFNETVEDFLDLLHQLEPSVASNLRNKSLPKKFSLSSKKFDHGIKTERLERNYCQPIPGESLSYQSVSETESDSELSSTNRGSAPGTTRGVFTTALTWLGNQGAHAVVNLLKKPETERLVENIVSAGVHWATGNIQDEFKHHADPGSHPPPSPQLWYPVFGIPQPIPYQPQAPFNQVYPPYNPYQPQIQGYSSPGYPQNPYPPQNPATQSPIQYQPQNPATQLPIQYQPQNPATQLPIQYQPQNPANKPPIKYQPQNPADQPPIQYQPQNSSGQPGSKYQLKSPANQPPSQYQPQYPDNLPPTAYEAVSVYQPSILSDQPPNQSNQPPIPNNHTPSSAEQALSRDQNPKPTKQPYPTTSLNPTRSHNPTRSPNPTRSAYQLWSAHPITASAYPVGTDHPTTPPYHSRVAHPITKSAYPVIPDHLNSPACYSWSAHSVIPDHPTSPPYHSWSATPINKSAYPGTPNHPTIAPHSSLIIPVASETDVGPSKTYRPYEEIEGEIFYSLKEISHRVHSLLNKLVCN